jgi:hypothetical protein
MEIFDINIMMELIVLSLILFICYLCIHLHEFVTEQKNFIKSVPEMTPRQIKSLPMQIYRYYLIIKLQNMKKYLGISLVIIVLAVCSIAVLEYQNYGIYMKDYFEVKTKKLNLRKEAQVDSIIKLLNVNKKENDSLKQDVEMKNIKLEIYEKSSNSQMRSIHNLERIIKNSQQHD